MEALRLKHVRESLVDRGLDALLVTNSFNRRYLTGFTGSAGYVVITKDRAVLFTDFRYIRQAPEQTKEYQVIQHALKAIESIHEWLESEQVKKLGFEQNDVSFSAYAAYQEQFAGIEMVPTKEIVEHVRAYKDQKELDAIRKAVDITEQAFDRILKIMKPGMTELEVAAELEYLIRKNGAPSSAYNTIVASGERSALPHGLASDKKLGTNEFVTLDFGALYNGYCSDLTRTVFIGKPTEQQRDIYNIVLEANLTTLAGIKPGMSGKEVDSLGRDVIAKYGYAENFGHGLGHGFGLEIHEPLRLAQASKDILRPGMVLTVEPGIYIPGFGGVRIEDDILITDTGIEVLTKSDKSLILL